MREVAAVVDGVTRIFTFGYGNTDPHTGHKLAEKYARITAPTREMCRAVMLGLYGPHWGFEYGEEFVEQWIERGIPLPHEHIRIIVVEVDPTQSLADPALTMTEETPDVELA
jgi:hypothetical protein